MHVKACNLNIHNENHLILSNGCSSLLDCLSRSSEKAGHGKSTVDPSKQTADTTYNFMLTVPSELILKSGRMLKHI